MNEPRSQALSTSSTTSPQRGPTAPPIQVVEIEVCSRCNRRCSYCPVSLVPHPPVPAHISDIVFQTVVGQLSEVGFRGRISYHLYNEPLLNRELPRLVEIVADRLPDALQILNTNGDLLDDATYRLLRDAGIDYFYVTRHTAGDFPDRPFQVVQSAADLVLTNRGGLLTHLPEPSAETRRAPCHAPEEMLIVTVTGDVLLCYEDAGRRHVLGNVLEHHIAEIRSAPATRDLVERLRRGDRTAASICRSCSNTSHGYPGLSALEDPVLRHEGIARTADAITTLKARSRNARHTSPAPAPAVPNIFATRLIPEVAHCGSGVILSARIADSSQISGSCDFIDYADMPPGTSIGAHHHPVTQEEFYLVLEGTGTMQLDERFLQVRPGDLVRNPPGHVHGLVNDSPGPLRLFIFQVSVPQ